MPVLKTVIADPDQNFRERLTSNVRLEKNMEVVGTTDDGWSLLKILRKQDPDLLVMDLELKNSMDLLSYIQQKARTLKILALSHTSNDMSEPFASELAISFFRKEDCQIDHLIQFMREMCRNTLGADQDRMIERNISVSLRRFGIPTHMKGYRYLRRAIRVVMENPETMSGVTKVLYPDIAKCYDTTASCVERAIRNAIEAAWTKKDFGCSTYFGYAGDAPVGKPTNSQFIAAVADSLCLQQPNLLG